MEKTIGRKPRRKVHGKVLFLKDHETKALVAVTHEAQEFREKVLRPFVFGLRPPLSRTQFNTHDLQSLLESLNSNPNVISVNAEKVAAKRKLADVKKPTTESLIRWTDIPISVAFEELEEKEAWLHAITVEVKYRVPNPKKADKDTVLTGRIGIKRSGETWISGQPLIFLFNSVFVPVLFHLRKKFDQLRNRERVKEDGYRLHPLCIEFDTEVFSQRESIEQLMRVLDLLKNTSFSVYHSNPSFHASLLDYYDNSSYEIFVLSNRRITIVPQMKATEGSLTRILEQVMRHFGEGSIRDYRDIYKELNL